jgi:hypothetical protein
MFSRKAVSVLGMGTWLAVALTAVPGFADRHHSRSVSADDESPVTDCSGLHIRFDDRDAVVQSEERTITKGEAPELRVTAEKNGGLQVRGWGKDTYSVTLCKAAEPGGDAESMLSQIKLNFADGEVSVTGPSAHENWTAFLLVNAPKAAVLDLRVNNGPMSIYGVEGGVKAQAVNGPVTLKDSKGEISLSAQNGPISVDGNSGKLSVHTQNGPVDVALRGQNWTGAGMEAHATNGPVTIRVPSGYQSGVLVESDGNGPFSCRASVCSEGRKTWDDDHKRVEFGKGPTVIRVSTVNGPVSVQ